MLCTRNAVNGAPRSSCRPPASRSLRLRAVCSRSSNDLLRRPRAREHGKESESAVALGVHGLEVERAGTVEGGGAQQRAILSRRACGRSRTCRERNPPPPAPAAAPGPAKRSAWGATSRSARMRASLLGRPLDDRLDRRGAIGVRGGLDDSDGTDSFGAPDLLQLVGLRMRSQPAWARQSGRSPSSAPSSDQLRQLTGGAHLRIGRLRVGEVRIDQLRLRRHVIPRGLELDAVLGIGNHDRRQLLERPGHTPARRALADRRQPPASRRLHAIGERHV